MSYFQPAMYPDSPYTLHRPIRPATADPSTSQPLLATSGGDMAYQMGSHGDADGERPCVPPHRPCPGPIPPHEADIETTPGDQAYGHLRPHMHCCYTPQECQTCSSSPSSLSALPTHSATPSTTLQAIDSSPLPLRSQSHSLSQGLPISQLACASSYSSQPRGHIPPHIQSQDNGDCQGHGPPPTASLPPSYKPLPSSAEDTLLLAPPPSFYASTCPFSHHYQTHDLGLSPTSPHSRWLLSRSQSRQQRRGSRNAEPLLPVHSRRGSIAHHTSPHCFDLHVNDACYDDPESPGRDSESMDSIAVLLVLLNIVVWGAVIYGFVREFANGGDGSGEWHWPALGNMLGIDAEALKFSVSSACLGPAGAAGWGQICAGEDCRWAFVDC
ncbi:hypothetical protein IAU59_004410 [Kwoniella sp. CBS 9459]